MSKPCETCSLQATGDGVAITDQKKWLTSPCPCPECAERSEKDAESYGAKLAERLESRYFEAMFGSNHR